MTTDALTGSSRARLVRLLLVLLAVSAVQPGAWALFAPRSFHVTFPGAGLHWIADLGSYNEHLVRDVGAFYLGLAVLSGLAARSLNRQLVQATAVSWLVFQVGHVLVHLHLTAHLDLSAALQIITLTVQLAAVVAVAVLTHRPEEHSKG